MHLTINAIANSACVCVSVCTKGNLQREKLHFSGEPSSPRNSHVPSKMEAALYESACGGPGNKLQLHRQLLHSQWLRESNYAAEWSVLFRRTRSEKQAMARSPKRFMALNDAGQ